MKLKLPRGIRDIDPELYEKFLCIYDAFIETCRIFNFKVMEPATIELFETLALKSGPDIEKEIYAFKDKKGRLLGLRFDLTVGLTRYVVSNPHLPKPVKLAAFSVQWRYDEPQFGRYRSFYAWDIEIFGGEEEFSATEVLCFCEYLFRKLGLKNYIFKLSDRRLVEGLIQNLFEGINPIVIMRIIDKINRYPEDEIISMMVESGMSKEESGILLSYIKSKGNIGEVISIAKYDGPLLKVYDKLKDLNIPCEIDIGIVRGLDYYDGIVFEVYDKKALDVGAICGGGSYTQLVKTFGGNVNAWGAAGGVERLIIALEKEGIKLRTNNNIRVYIATAGVEYIDYAFKIAKSLRLAGLPTDINVTRRSLISQLEYADKLSYDYTLIIGKKEVTTGTFLVRDMRRREQHAFRSLNEVIDYIKGR